MSRLICLAGKARVGKSRILNYLQENYSDTLCFPDTTNALHVYQEAAGHLYQLSSLYLNGGSIFDWVKEHGPMLLKDYDTLKASAEETGTQQFLRHTCIGFAELARVFYPDFWVKVAKDLWWEEGKVAVSTILNEGEYLEALKHYDTIDLVYLNCVNPKLEAEQDTRDTSFTSFYGAYEFVYKLEDSLKIAENIYQLIMEEE